MSLFNSWAALKPQMKSRHIHTFLRKIFVAFLVEQLHMLLYPVQRYNKIHIFQPYQYKTLRTEMLLKSLLVLVGLFHLPVSGFMQVNMTLWLKASETYRTSYSAWTWFFCMCSNIWTTSLPLYYHSFSDRKASSISGQDFSFNILPVHPVQQPESPSKLVWI